MPNTTSHLHQFKKDISEYTLPDKFTFPFYYEPHPLAVLAADELCLYLKTQKVWNHDFGLDGVESKASIGKMFGVLVVKDTNNQLGFLTAFSGKLDGNVYPEYFVPPIYNIRGEGSFYNEREKELVGISDSIDELETNSEYLACKKHYESVLAYATTDIENAKALLRQYKSERKDIRKKAEGTVSDEELKLVLEELKADSFRDQFYIKELTLYRENQIYQARSKFDEFSTKISLLKTERKQKSNQLQQDLFGKYQFINKAGDYKGVLDIFNDQRFSHPAGAGDCCAPRLLQYAFKNHLSPICMAEFWWGTSPAGSVRQHKQYYPACQGRCKPILGHMLQGIEMDDNPFMENTAIGRDLPIIFEDDAIIIINKPSEFLSVSGKLVDDSVYTRIKERYPEATGPLIVHRLDMSTSGIMVVTKTKEAHEYIQYQFIKRLIKKRYIAVLDGEIEGEKGEINLPLRLDIDDRPRQMVCYDKGKQSKTRWELISKQDGKSRVYYYPESGRTHQLRVHSSHPKGLHSPIVGDDLYGVKKDRLHLHAEFIQFKHPLTKEIVSFQADPEF